MIESKKGGNESAVKRLVLTTYFSVDDICPIIAVVTLKEGFLHRVKDLAESVRDVKVWCIKDKSRKVRVEWLCDDEAEDWPRDVVLHVSKNKFWFESQDPTGPITCGVPIATLRSALAGRNATTTCCKKVDEILFVAEDRFGLNALISEYTYREAR